MRKADVLSFMALLVALAVPRPSAGQAGPVEGVVRTGAEPAGAVVVWLQSDRLSEEAPVQRPATPAVIDQNNLRFLPGVVAVRTGTTVDFLNSDGILHNVFSPGWSGDEFDLGTYPSGAVRSHTFSESGPHVILCKVHPEMVAYVVVVETPYFAVTDAEGRFRIGSVPAGRYQLSAWQRGAADWQAELAVPSGGVESLTVDLSAPGRLASSGTR